MKRSFFKTMLSTKQPSLRNGGHAALAGMLVLLTATPASADQNFVSDARLPENAEQTCTTNISSWFVGGQVSANGWVQPANSLNPVFKEFKTNTRCDFYQWGAQMFLWLTSGVGAKHVFNTAPGFYNVSVAADNKRKFIAQDGPMMLAVRALKPNTEIETGQAGGGDVLLSQKGSLVYYGVHANDVFALYTSGQKTGAFTSDKTLNSQFPSTPEQLDLVSAFAANYGYPLGWDKMALAMELKTAWVDAATVDKSKYVLTQAVVPVFDRHKPNIWPITGTEEKTLALVGVHVVGTVNGHPEMIWATFEHVDNVPDNSYVYNDVAQKPHTRKYDSEGRDWTFLKKGAAQPGSITANAKAENDPKGTSTLAINGIGSASIDSVEVLRQNPWGGLPDASSAANNTDLVSLNVSVLEQLSAGDIRGNYIQTGGIWTTQGLIPANGTDSNLTGSLFLANTTMETFHQYFKSGDNENCFSCHGTTSNGYEVSHIYNALQPLPKK